MSRGPQGPTVRITVPGVTPHSNAFMKVRNIMPRTDQGLRSRSGSCQSTGRFLCARLDDTSDQA